MSDVPVSLHRLVVERARNRCEYCGLHQVGQEATFHIDHVVPQVARGETRLENLAFACVSCSLRKGSRQLAPDPTTLQETPLFSPRENSWDDHFEWNGVRIVPLTAIGRATVEALKLNRPTILSIREEEAFRGRHP